VGVQRHTPAPYPWERETVLTVQKAGWAQGQSGRLRKFLPQPGLDPRTVLAVASRYTDCAIPVRSEFQGKPGNAFVADIASPETRSNFNGPNQTSKVGSLKQNLNPTHCSSITNPRILLNKRKNKHPLRSKARGRIMAAKLTRPRKGRFSITKWQKAILPAVRAPSGQFANF
jgi:hypothetical protein